MKIRNLVAYITLLLVLAGFVTACSGNGQQAAPLVYTDIATKIQVYEDSYREFVNSGNGEVALVTATSVTPLGAPCNSKYTISSDGLYESCSLVVQRDDTRRLKGGNGMPGGEGEIVLPLNDQRDQFAEDLVLVVIGSGSLA